MAIKETIEVDPTSPELTRRRGIVAIVADKTGLDDPNKLKPNRALPGDDNSVSLWSGGLTGMLLEESERRAEAAKRLGVRQNGLTQLIENGLIYDMQLDEILNKQVFSSKYKAMGYADDQIEREWVKLQRDFVISCVKKYLEVLPDDVEKPLEEEFKRTKNEDEAHKFFADLLGYFDKHPGLLDETATVTVVANDIKKKYNI